MGTLDINGAWLYYEERGSGQPVVFVHDSIVDSRMWQPQIDALAGQYRVIRYDLRGFGQSSRPSSPFSHTADLIALLEYLKLDPVHIVGHAAGAQIALSAALLQPDRFKSLVLISPIISGFTKFSATLVQYATEIQQAIAESDYLGAAELLMRLWVDSPHRSPRSVDVTMRMRLHRQVSDNLYTFAAPDLEQASESPLHQLVTLHIPTLVVLGEVDLSDVHNMADAIIQGIPSGVECLTLPKVGHFLNLEQPAACNQMLATFWQSQR